MTTVQNSHLSRWLARAAAFAFSLLHPLCMSGQEPTVTTGVPGEIIGYGSGGSQGLFQFMIMEGKNGSGNEQLKVQTASRLLEFSYQLTTLKPVSIPGSYGGGGYGGAGMMAGGSGGEGGMMGGYGGGSGYGGSMGGSEMGGMGMEGDYGGERSDTQPTIHIWAYVFANDRENNRTKIELVTLPPATSQGMMGPGMMDMGMGAGMDGGMMGEVPRYVRLATLVGPVSPGKPNTDKVRLSPAEYDVVSKTILQKIWKEETLQAFRASKGVGDDAAEQEKLLKELITEEYDTQLARQEMEVQSIEQKIEALKAEINRRRVAKDRVIDVQLGNLVLEAQGLLGP